MSASDSGALRYAGEVRVFDTDAEFQEMQRWGNIVIEGTGSEAVLTVKDTEQTMDLCRYPNEAYNIMYTDCRSSGYWYDRDNVIGECNGKSTKADVPAQICHTDILRLAGFEFDVPSYAWITGVEAIVLRRQSGTVKRTDHITRLRINDVPSENKADTVNYWPQTYQSKSYGGKDDLWGYDNISVKDLDTLKFEISAQNYYTRAGGTFYIDCACVKIHYLRPHYGWAEYDVHGSETGGTLGILKIKCIFPEDGGDATLSVFQGREKLDQYELKDGENTIDLNHIKAENYFYTFTFFLMGGKSSKPKIDYIKHYVQVEKEF